MVRRGLIGSALGVVLAVGLGAAMVPLRAHISVASAGLVLIVPVVAGATLGGYGAGLVSITAGFLVYDYAFIPPYYTLTVGTAQNWIALGVYAVVMVLVARVVANLERATQATRARAANARRLIRLTELLLADRPVEELAPTIVRAVKESFGIGGVALLLSQGGILDVAASAGEDIGAQTLSRLRPDSHTPVSLTTDTSSDRVQALALASSGRPVGLLVLTDVPSAAAVREILPALANHVALALERSDMHKRLRQAEVLEEVDRLRHALVGAVSHDLRTPLASIKVASSTLVNPAAELSKSDTEELHALIDTQTDRLTKLVNDVLDMTRIQAGSLVPRLESRSTLDLVAAAVSVLRPSLEDRVIEVNVPPWLPLVHVDHLLVEQTLYNILDNADRHAPPGTPITVEADVDSYGKVVVSVTDSGTGVPAEERDAVFDTFVRFDTGGRAGLGLAIAKAFIEAHGERIWVDDVPGRGAQFAFTLPIAGTNGSRS
jgi:two-component system sensor histidine kinase KdpD